MIRIDRTSESPGFGSVRRAVLLGVGACAIAMAVAANAGQAPAQPARGAGPAAPPAAPAVVVARTFTGSVGLAFNTVRPDRVIDFETLLAEVQQALARSTNPATQAQAKAWRFFKAAEAGPNGSVMYVFIVDPVAPGEDYSLGKTLVEAFPDAAKLQEIWKLYTGSVTGGGSLLSLTPVSATPPVVPARGGRGLPDPATIQPVLPADRDPNR